MEMLASLQYYWDLWPRARTFAILTNCLKPLIQDVNIAKNQPQLAIPNVDIYLQEFFLHAYSILIKYRDSMQDSKDGFTYITINVEAENTSSLMTWFGEQDNRRWGGRVRRNTKRMKSV